MASTRLKFQIFTPPYLGTCVIHFKANPACTFSSRIVYIVPHRTVRLILSPGVFSFIFAFDINSPQQQLSEKPMSPEQLSNLPAM